MALFALFLKDWPLNTEEPTVSLVKIIVITILLILSILLFGRLFI